jgi:hypothetical protein
MHRIINILHACVRRPALAAIGIAFLFRTPPGFATTDACWFETETLKLEKTLVVPPEEHARFINYLRTQITDGLSRSEVESDRRLSLIYQNVESGILAITIDYSKVPQTFSASVKACDFKEDWKPYWQYVEAKIEAFSPAVQLK